MPSPDAVLRQSQAYPESALPAGIQKLVRPAALAKAQALAFLMFEKPDLAETERFLADFGMCVVSRTPERLVMRGADSSPCIYVANRARRSRYVGAAFTVADPGELARLETQAGAQKLAGSAIPGGGEGVALTDPAGNLVWMIAGQDEVAPLPMRQPTHITSNGPGLTPRLNAIVRPPIEPSLVARIGHVVLQTVDFAEMAKWYMRHLGVIPTDVQYLPDGSPNLAFFRLDRGAQPADHHTLVLAGGIEDKYEHSAYEVLDLDALGHGQNVLRANGHRHMWGIGRHTLGSQLFDYWYDPDGMEFEHYTDGDVFTSDYETHYLPLDLAGIWAWGADVPSSMVPRPSLKTIYQVARLIHSGRLSVDRVRLLMQATGAKSRPWL